MSSQGILLLVLVVGIVIGSIWVLSGITTGYESQPRTKPADASEDVWDVMPVETRKEIFKRDWYERQRIEEYVQTHWPVDFNASRARMDRQFAKQDNEWSRLYEKFEQDICNEYGVPLWQFWQILDEGMKYHWQEEFSSP